MNKKQTVRPPSEILADLQEVKAELEALKVDVPAPVSYILDRGWREMWDQFKPHARAFYATKQDRDHLPHCESNEKPPAVCLWQYPPYPGRDDPSFEVEISGERGGVWVKFQAYALMSLEDVVQGLHRVSEAWTECAE